ncbi:DNA-directed RNA polymerase III subunit rpc3 isoform X2 [Rhodamnia argentea]|uniref:DNA-directed RNA polymerase III subunit RPC3 n=1 Tax=Rhodamnia argentea TaxID=178133 RepID=A0ABM3HQ63_9MYRT|nr:DNA-directed RNA polymerase III subunit rpc3 isoform X2 [Rhodamnia argentea]
MSFRPSCDPLASSSSSNTWSPLVQRLEQEQEQRQRQQQPRGGGTMVPPSQYGIKYAVHIISSHFGDLVAKVCECLLRRGPLTHRNIVRFMEISASQVKNCLLVLIQQNCVQAFSVEHPGGDEDESRRSTEYMAVFDNIIHRMRFPKFVAVVSQELDKECVELFQGLLQHGRLTLEKMIDRAKSGQDCPAQDATRETLSKLINARFVERCPDPEPHLSPPSEEEGRARKRTKFSKVAAEPQTIEERVLAAAAPMEAKRFLTIFHTTTEEDGQKTECSFPGVGEKRKCDALESDKELGSDGSQVLWRVNVQEFMHRFRHKACVENVRERLDGGAAVALNAMLETSRSMEKKVKTDNAGPLTINTIYEEVMKGEAGRAMTLDHLRASLVMLGCERGTDESYQIDLKNIIELAQNEEVESVVLKRYGREAYRIFRLLSKANRLIETDKISSTAFVDKTETSKILFRLWKDEFLHMEKVVVTGPRQTQFLLWKVNKSTLWPHVLDEMYHAALNLNLRVAYELEKENELLNLPIEKRSGPLEKRYNRLRTVRLLLESSLMKLDDAIMLFHDF